MPIEITNGATVITGSAILLFRLMALKKGLEGEVKFGMQLTRGRSAFAIIKQEFGFKGSKVKVLEQFTAHVTSEQAKYKADPANGVAQ